MLIVLQSIAKAAVPDLRDLRAACESLHVMLLRGYQVKSGRGTADMAIRGICNAKPLTIVQLGLPRNIPSLGGGWGVVGVWVLEGCKHNSNTRNEQAPLGALDDSPALELLPRCSEGTCYTMFACKYIRRLLIYHVDCVHMIVYVHKHTQSMLQCRHPTLHML